MSDPKSVAAVYAAHRENDVPTLIRALAQSDTPHPAAGYLGDCGDKRAIKPLLPLLHAGDPHVRAAAAKSLGKLRALQARDDLIELAQGDSVVWVRERALDALLKIPDGSGTEVLMTALRDPEWSVRRFAISHLAVAPDGSRAVDDLERAAQDERWTRRRHYRRAIQEIQRNTK